MLAQVVHVPPQLIHKLVSINEYVTGIERVKFKLIHSVNISQILFLFTCPNIAQAWYHDGILNTPLPVPVQTHQAWQIHTHSKMFDSSSKLQINICNEALSSTTFELPSYNNTPSIHLYSGVDNFTDKCN